MRNKAWKWIVISSVRHQVQQTRGRQGGLVKNLVVEYKEGHQAVCFSCFVLLCFCVSLYFWGGEGWCKTWLLNNKDVRHHFVLCFYILCVSVNDFVSVYRFEAGRGWRKTWLLNKKEIRHFAFVVLCLCVIVFRYTACFFCIGQFFCLLYIFIFLLIWASNWGREGRCRSQLLNKKEIRHFVSQWQLTANGCLVAEFSCFQQIKNPPPTTMVQITALFLQGFFVISISPHLYYLYYLVKMILTQIQRHCFPVE